MVKPFYEIIFENEDFFIIDKLNGISFEGEDGLLNRIRLDHGQAFGIHRLDKDTSGLMMFAKNKEAQVGLSKLFQEKKVEKFYFALSSLRPKKKMGTIKGELVKARGGSYKLTKGLKNPSHTKFQSMFFDNNSLRGFLLRPYTGQTHQLRVHMKSIGSAILGDPRYGSLLKDSRLKADRMYLAAVYIKFEYLNETYEFYKYPEFGRYYEDLNISDELSSMISNFRN